MAKAKDPDAKKDAAEKRAGKPDVDSPAMARMEKKLGVGGAAPGPTQVFGANRRTPTPTPGPTVRNKKSSVGYGSSKKNKVGGARD